MYNDRKHRYDFMYQGKVVPAYQESHVPAGCVEILVPIGSVILIIVLHLLGII